MSLFFCNNNETDFIDRLTRDGVDPIILYTRDITHGRGRRDLAYAMIVCLYRSDPGSAMEALHLCASTYGSWCDIKYFCRYVSENLMDGDKDKDEMIDGAIDILVYQLRHDYAIWTDALAEHLDNLRVISRPIGRDILSYAAKWVPREKSAMGWLFDRIVERWANKDHYNSRYKREFRKMISELNREIGTVEIKQCAGDIHNIIYEQIPIRALVNQYRTFAGLEVYPKGGGVGGHSGSRAFEQMCQNLVRIALSRDDGKYDDMLNHIWSKNQTNYRPQDIIPIIDISTGCGGWNHAIGLGILIAQNSSHGRLILSEHDAYSIAIGRKDSFTSIIARIRPFLSGVTDSRLDLAIQISLGARVVVLSQSGNRHTQTFWSPIFYWFFGTDKNIDFTCNKGGANNIDCDYMYCDSTFNKGGAKNIDFDYAYCDSMYMLSHYANGGSSDDYINTILSSDRYRN
jgi:hypothetical protein